LQNEIHPAISVILPVYNGSKTVKYAIESILKQSFTHFELIIINDGSTDESFQICTQYKFDERVIVIDQKNHGLPATLNIGVARSKSPLIARQDQDDVSSIDRLEKQMNYLKAFPETVLLGTWSKIYTNNKDSGRRHHHPTNNRNLRLFLYFDNPFVHSSVVINKSALIAAGGYISEKQHQPEDYDLWTRLAGKGPIANLPYYGIEYHEVPLSMSRHIAKPFPFIHTISARYFQSNVKSGSTVSEQWAMFIWSETEKMNIFLFLACVIRILLREKFISKCFLKRTLHLLKRILFKSK
jgi:glycosyltransferase involved in cell wall biosynthesis